MISFVSRPYARPPTASRYQTASLLATTAVSALLFALPKSASAAPSAGPSVTGNVMTVTNAAGQSITSVFIVNANVAGAVMNAGTITPGKTVNGLTVGILVAQSTVGGGVLNTGSITVTPQQQIGVGVLLIASRVSAGAAAGAIVNDGALTVRGINSAAAGIFTSSSVVAGDAINDATITTSSNSAALGLDMVAIQLTGNVLNSGTITALSKNVATGIKLSGNTIPAAAGEGAIVNSGTIIANAAQSGTGVQIKASAVPGGITNTGTIFGTKSALVLANQQNATTITQSAQALIGGVTGAGADVLDVTGGALSFQPKSVGRGLASLDQTGGNVVLQVTTSTAAGTFPTVNVTNLVLSGVLEVGPQAGTFAPGQTITYPNVFTANAITNDITSVKVFDFFSADVTGTLTAGNKGSLSVTLTNTGKMSLKPGVASGAGAFTGLTNPLGAILPAISVTNGASVNGGITNAGFIGVPGTPQATGILVSGGQLSQPITNTGTIAGTTAAIDVSNAAAAATIVQSAGTILGAIKLSANADVLTINGGTIAGNITGQGTSDTVNIASANNANDTFLYANTISGIGTINLAAGANLALTQQGAINSTGLLNLAPTSKITGAGAITQSGTTALQFANNIAAGAYPTINATTISLSGKLQVVLTGAFPGSGMQDFVKVFAAAGTLTNNIDPTNVSVTTNGATLPAGTNVTARLVQSGNSADVVVVETAAAATAAGVVNTPANGGFVTAGLTRNEAAVASALNGVLLADTPTSQGLLTALLHSNAAALPRDFDALSGEIHASTVTAGFDDSLLARSAILSHLSEPLAPPSFDSGALTASAIPADLRSSKEANHIPVEVAMRQPRLFNVWGQGFGDWGHVQGDGNAASLSRSTTGFVLGGDVTARDLLAGDWRFGLAAGTTDDRTTVSQRLSSARFESTFGGVYAGARFGAVELRAGTLYGANSVSTKRTVIVPGFSDALSSSNAGFTAQSFAEGGYRLELPDARFACVELTRASVEPFAGAAAVLIHQNGFTEGGGASALTGFGRDFNIQTTTLGWRSEVEFASLPVSVASMLGWRHAFGDVVPSVLLGFQGGAQSFTVAGGRIDRDAFIAEAGVKYAVNSRVSASLSYAGQVGQRGTANAFKTRIDVNF